MEFGLEMTICNGTTLALHWHAGGQTMAANCDCIGIAQTPPHVSADIALVLPHYTAESLAGHCHGTGTTPLVLHCAVLVLHLYCTETARLPRMYNAAAVLLLQWFCTGAPMILRWRYTATELVLHCHLIGPGLVLRWLH